MDRSLEDALTRNADGLRRMTLALCSDEASAADLGQSVRLAVLEGAQPAGNGWGPWLRGITRRIALGERRAEGRRRFREEAAARHEATPSAADLAARVELEERVARALLDLPESQRQVLVLRYWEGLPPRDVAAHLGIGVEAVRSRQKRALALLRTRLAGEEGVDHKHAVAGAFAASGPSAISILVMKKTLLVAGALGALVVATLAIRDLRFAGVSVESGADARVGALAVDRVDAPEAGRVSLGPVGVEEARLAQRSSAAPGVEVDAAAISVNSGPMIRGRVVLPDGTPVPGVSVTARLDEVGVDDEEESGRAVADDDGSFEIMLTRDGAYRMEVTGDAKLPIVGSNVFEPDGRSRQLVVEALVVDVSARGALDGVAPMSTLALAAQRSAMQRRFDPPVEGHVLTLECDREYVLRAETTDGSRCFGLIDPSAAPQRIELELREDAPEFGSLEIAALGAGFDRGARLVQSSIDRDGRFILVGGSSKLPSEHRCVLTLDGLLPGRYEVDLTLLDDRYVALARDRVDERVDAGARVEVDVETWVGGVLEIAVTTSAPVEGRRFAGIRLRRPGLEEWTERTFVTEEESSTMYGTGALVGGIAATSEPIRPGEYELAIELDGYRSDVRRVRILERVTERIDLVLHEAD